MDMHPHDTNNRIWGLLRELSIPLAFSIVYPLAFFYGLRFIGLNAFHSLLIGALPILGFQVYRFIKKGKIDLLGSLMLGILALSVTMAFITGSARFMLAKAGVFIAFIGSVFLISLAFKKPLVFTLASYMLQRINISREHLESLWAGQAGFRRVWRVSTIIWGGSMLMNAGIVMLIAYMLPIDIVPVLNTVLNLFFFVMVQIVTHIYYKKQGVWRLVFYPVATEGNPELN